MIVLDTNVVSELMRPSPDGRMLAWVDQWPSDRLWLTSMTAAELLAGVATLPGGARRQRLGQRVRELLTVVFVDRIAPFDQDAAAIYANVLRRRSEQGRPVGIADAIIAATALAAGAELLATRHTSDFTDTGVELFNPWRASD
ncbi:PIN domain-containing protein [Amnibacterium endophyticum]|uniref:Ribonuclease VapC n=1 Tax=Amnibacterium endophyticum TaxID=2109337 RepID=A0ABW4LFU7_9MICO